MVLGTISFNSVYFCFHISTGKSTQMPNVREICLFPVSPHLFPLKFRGELFITRRCCNDLTSILMPSLLVTTLQWTGMLSSIVLLDSTEERAQGLPSVHGSGRLSSLFSLLSTDICAKQQYLFYLQSYISFLQPIGAQSQGLGFK